MKNYLNLLKLSFCGVLFIALISSCTKREDEYPANNDPTSVTSVKKIFDSFAIDVVSQPDLSVYNRKEATKSSGPVFFNAKELLWDQATQLITNDSLLFTQIPLKSNSRNIATFSLKEEELGRVDTRSVKYFLVIAQNLNNDSISYRVITMIKFNEEYESHPDFHYLDKGNFIGIIIYSNIAGEYICSDVYYGTKRLRVKLLDKTDRSTTPLFYISLSSILSTKGESQAEPEPIFGKEFDDIFVIGQCGSGESGGGGDYVISSSNRGSVTWPDDPNSGNLPDGMPSHGGGNTETSSSPLEISLTLTAGPGGSVSGSGRYGWGQTIPVQAVAFSGYKFDRWNGAFAGKPAGFSYQIFEEASATACFLKVPCTDIANGKSSPLTNLALAPPNSWNIAGATYGTTRYEEGKSVPTIHHSGIDFAGEIGEPVYAMFDGTIEEIIDEQPNRIGNDKYPSGYNKDNNNAGNRITICSTVNGSSVQTKYWHLQAGNPVAVNLRTGVPFKKGNSVYQGDIIGYIGITGNPNPLVPHLHLKIIKNEQEVNPNTYLNATITTTSTAISTPCNH